MKTLREYIDQLDEISRRDFLKGAAATAGLAAMGISKSALATQFLNANTANKPLVWYYSQWLQWFTGHIEIDSIDWKYTKYPEMEKIKSRISEINTALDIVYDEIKLRPNSQKMIAEIDSITARAQEDANQLQTNFINNLVYTNGGPRKSGGSSRMINPEYTAGKSKEPYNSYIIDELIKIVKPRYEKLESLLS